MAHSTLNAIHNLLNCQSESSDFYDNNTFIPPKAGSSWDGRLGRLKNEKTKFPKIVRAEILSFKTQNMDFCFYRSTSPNVGLRRTLSTTKYSTVFSRWMRWIYRFSFVFIFSHKPFDDYRILINFFNTQSNLHRPVH